MENILKHRRSASKRQLEYFVKWKNHPQSEKSWVKESNFNTMEIISDYWKNLGTSPKPIKLFKMTPYKFMLVSLFLLLFVCTSGSAQKVITETLPFCNMTKTPPFIEMHKSYHHSRVNTGKATFFEKKLYKNWRADDTDELIDTATLVPIINVIAPKSNKIEGTGWQCHMSKFFTIYYKIF